MKDDQLETVTILAKLIRRGRVYQSGIGQSTVAVPITEIAQVLEQFTSTQTAKLVGQKS